MVLDMDLISKTIEAIIEVGIAANDVFFKKDNFMELASNLNRIIPLLKELHKNNIGHSEALNNMVETLNREIEVAKQLIVECSKRNRVYLFVNYRSIAKRIEKINKEISHALSLIPLASLDVSLNIVDDINQLCDSMRTAEFKAAIADEEILEKIDSGIQERNVDRSDAYNLVILIANNLGISTERSVLKKEFEEFKTEIENAKLKKDHAEAIQLEQIIALLERADATSSLEEKEIKYLSKRNSLGCQPLEPLQSFYCPITREVMADPVETSSGQTFERSAIEKWLASGNNLCPLTLIPLETSILRPNKTLRQSIEEWQERNMMITIASLKQKILSNEEEEIINCLEQLQDLCEQRNIHREWIILENYIPILIDLLMAKDRSIRDRALAILCLLAKDNNDAKERIARVDNALDSIVSSLGRRKLALRLLLELSKSELVRQSIGKVKGCIIYLVNIANGDDNQAAGDARELLQTLSFCDQNVMQMAKTNYFKHLLERLSSGPSAVKMIMATTLAEMELTDFYKSSLFGEGVLDSLLQLIAQGDDQMKEVAVKALRNLSSLPSNGQEMISKGSVTTLLNLLYHPTSSPSLREQLAATIMHLAMSTTSNISGNNPVTLFESDEEICTLFSYINLTVPAVQQNILRAFHAICQSPTAGNVKAKLNQISAVQFLVPLCELDNENVRANAIKLLCCLTKDGDEVNMIEHFSQKSIETLIRIIKTSTDDEEIASAMAIISNLPESPEIIEWLLGAGGLPVISSHLSDRGQSGPTPHKNKLIENAVAAMCHFTLPINQESQRKAAESGIIPVLVQLLDQGTSLTRKRAAICLAQFSKSSHRLTRSIPKRHGLWCFSAPPETRCPAHRGICTVESSFCLVEAGALPALVRLLADSNVGSCEASLDALLTLIEDERLQSGSKVLDEERAIPLIIKLLDVPSPPLQEKVLSSLERIFRVLEIKQKYGASAQIPLVALTQRGNSSIKSLAARILAQLNVLHDQSSYF